MASSSSLSYKYDAFLSFRGEDTRDNFTSHLYAALCRKKVITFIDNEKLRRGDDISSTLLNAIECSKISVIIFSKHYADSKWCLDELVKILQCHQMNGQMVIPVFYRVDPSHVRKQNVSFGDAFVEHEKHLNDMPEKIQKWRDALTQASNLSGWASKDNRSEAELIELIVIDILKKLEKVTTSTTFFDGFVGLLSRVEEIISLLCIGSPDIQIVGIWGMGGIGKTTIAGVIFNKYSREFEGNCFLANVREESENGGGLIYLRERILSEILEQNIRIGTPDLPEYIKGRLRRMKVLIVLDDVNTVKQLNYLAGGIDRFGPGSRVIITTRDRRVLRNFGVCVANIYEVRGLEYHDAFELFCNCAFKKNHCPTDDLLALSQSVLKFADGNPLALRVLGSFFGQKSKLDFETSLDYLNQIFDPDIYDVLKISYNDLQQEVKSIFLDIACFFVGEHRDFVRRILDLPKFADYGLNILIEKSLITISDCDQIQMHDLLQEMGREIVRKEFVKEPGKRSRLWNHEDIYHVLKKNRGTDAIEGIFLNLSKIRDIHLASRVFANMSNLRLLKFYVPKLDGAPILCSKIYLDQGLEYLPDELRYLYWHNYPLKSLPSNFDPENLIALNLPYSEVDKIWKGEKEALKLTFIDLHRSRYLTKIPEPLEFQILIKLELSETAIEEVPSSIECLTDLKELHLSNCTRLRGLPTSISKLKSLLKLNLHGNRGLGSSLPLLSSLSTLVWLNLSDCAVMEIPQDIGRLSSLVDLGLSGNKLKSLPVSIGNLSLLRYLDLSRNNLRSLPASIGSLSSLQDLNLNENNLKSLPSSIGCLSSLWSLDLHGNNFEDIIPASIGCLSLLRYLDLSRNNLRSLPASIGCLSSLECLNLNENNLESLPSSIGCLSSLRLLNLYGNDFEGLPSTLKQLSQLQCLILSNCNRLQSLPELPLSLKTLCARNCKRLQSLPKFPSCLQELDTSIIERLCYLGSNLMVMDFNFANCMKLNENANNFLEDSQQIFQHMVLTSLRRTLEQENTHYFYPILTPADIVSALLLPGWKIPDWVINRSLFNSITIQMPFHCGNRNFIGFSVCVVIGGLDSIYFYNFVECDYRFKIVTPSETKHVRKKCRFFFVMDSVFDMEHILLGFCPCWNVGLPDDDGDHDTTVSFHFSLHISLEDKIVTLGNNLRCCGVCPVYLNADEMKTNSLTLKFAAANEGECT